MTLVITSPTDRIRIANLDRDSVSQVRAMHDRSSARTRYHRWHGHVRAFPAEYLRTLTDPDAGHLAVVAYRDNRVVGVAEAVRTGPGIRELGLLVEDAWQRRGIGGQLLGELVARCRQAGTTVLRAEVLVDDRALLEPLRQLGPTATHLTAGVVRATVLLRAS